MEETNNGKSDKEEETEKALALQKSLAPQIMLTVAETLKVAKLANLEIAGGEAEKTAATLSAILGHIEQLNRLDTGAVEPTSHVIAVENVFRADEARRPFEGADALGNAPAQAKNYFSVPRIIE